MAVLLSLDLILSGKLKNLKNIDKWSSLSLCLSVKGMSVTRELGLCLCSADGSNGALSPEVHGDIAPSINIQYNTRLNLIFCSTGISCKQSLHVPTSPNRFGSVKRKYCLR